MRGFLQNNFTNLNDTNELDQFIGGCIHSIKLFHISCDDRKSLDPVMLQQFLQGTLINTLTVYLCELELPNGPSLSSYCCATANDDSDDSLSSQAKFRACLKVLTHSVVVELLEFTSWISFLIQCVILTSFPLKCTLLPSTL